MEISAEEIRKFYEWKAKAKESQRKYRETHTEDINKRRAVYYEQNKETIRVRNAEYKRQQRKRDKEKEAYDINERVDKRSVDGQV